MSPEEKILAKMRKLHDQGREPELTTNDVAVLLGVDRRATYAPLRKLSVSKAVQRIKLRGDADFSVWRLSDGL